MARSTIPSRMAIAHHPLHPMLIHFPVAALLGLVATDLTFIFTGDAFWARASFWLVGIGALGGWVSGTIGLLDLLTVGAIRRLVTAWSHALLAVLSLSLASFNWLLRLGGDMQSWIQPWGLSLSLLTALILSLTAMLGGQLVYEHGVGVEPEPPKG